MGSRNWKSHEGKYEQDNGHGPHHYHNGGYRNDNGMMGEPEIGGWRYHQGYPPWTNQQVHHISPTSAYNQSGYVSDDPRRHPPEPDEDEDERSPVQKSRKCRDVLCLGFFMASVLVMIGIAVYALINGNLQRFTNGIDIDCDICGIQNGPIRGFPNSGKDLRRYPFLVTHVPKDSSKIALGPFEFPSQIERMTFPPIQLTSSPTTQKCQTKCPEESDVFFNRCTIKSMNQTGHDVKPKNSPTAQNSTNPVQDIKSFFEEIGADIQRTYKEILWMCLISLGIAIFVTILLRIFAGIIIWFLVFAIGLTAIGGSIALWIFWGSKRNDRGDWTQGQVTGLMILAGVVSILTVILLLVLIFMRKRIGLVIQLFNEAGKAIHATPLILVQPLFTFGALGFALGSWLVVAMLIESGGSPMSEEREGILECHYKTDKFTIFSRWWNLFIILWMTQFIVGCQHVIIAGTVSIWFFTRNKKKLRYPIFTSIYRLIRYHLGSVAFGSLIIAIVRLIRYILSSIQKRLSAANAFCRGVTFCCSCCIWLLEKFLIFLNRNAYIEIAIYGYGFCKSARKAFNVVVNNALRIAAINSIGDFVLFLAKIAIVALSIFIGYELLKDKEGLNHVWAPLVIGGFFTYFIAHCFVSIYEMAIDTIFICFCEDMELNNGQERPYYMSKGLMEFVSISRKLDKRKKSRRNPRNNQD